MTKPLQHRQAIERTAPFEQWPDNQKSSNIWGEARGCPVLPQEAMPSSAFGLFDRRRNNLEKP